MLLIITTFVNLLALAISLWLGFYIVTRSPRSRLSWLATLTLWSLTSLFFHNALAIHLPGSGVLPWLRPVVVLALPFWFHLTLLLLPERARRRVWFHLPLLLPKRVRRPARRLSPTVSRLGVPLVYGVAFAFIVASMVWTQDLGSKADTDPAIYTSGRMAGPFYPFSIIYLFLMAVLSLLNLWQGRQQVDDTTLRRQFTLLLVGTALAGSGGSYNSLGIWLRLELPAVPGDVVLGASVILFGYAVARYNALVEGRTIKRDFPYTILAISLLTVFYALIALVLYYGGHLSFLAVILTIVGTISSHSLYDGVRTTLDRLFYHEQFQQLRANLRALAHEAGTGEVLPDHLQAIINALCHALRIRKGFIALRQEDVFVVRATEEANPVDQAFPLPALATTEIVDLPRPGTHGPQGMALLVPLYAGGAQVGALVLGPQESDQPYSEDDLELLDDLADQMATVIHTSRLQEENARTINAMVAEFRNRERTLQRQVQQMLAQREEEARPVLEGVSEADFVSLVEDGLRRLHDFSYLGEHALAQLQVVDWWLESQKDPLVTHIDRGKALNEILLQALHKLRPEDAEPGAHDVPSREWHQFIILHDSYVAGKLNRDVMSRLYISDGTFNRTRRRAVRGVAKALQEMEQAARKRNG
ncbi:MAG: GAF domain-containing protein [Anaerolineae bacterium]